MALIPFSRRSTRGLLAAACAAVMTTGSQPGALAQANQGTQSLWEMRWDQGTGFRNLTYRIGDTRKRRITDWNLYLNKKKRREKVLKLLVTVPDYWTGRFWPERISLRACDLGSVIKRSRCQEEVPADMTIDAEAGRIEFYPHSALDPDQSYGVIFDKIKNPRRAGEYQFNLLAELSNDRGIVIPQYLGSWVVSVD